MNIFDFHAKKKQLEKITMVTCYDYTSARIIAQTNVDCILVGDSVAMVIHGFQDTINATLEMMVLHTAAVKRGAPLKFIVADLPFLSYRKSMSESVTAAQMLMQAGANAVKLESACGNSHIVKHFVESGIPVMGHLGLTPQYIHTLGGYKIQGKTAESRQQLKSDALALQEAGCFALVLECVPEAAAREITSHLNIPTIGIGAGANTDGQVLVMQDLLGLNQAFQAKFVKRFSDGETMFRKAIDDYVDAVRRQNFPTSEHSFE